MEIRYVWILSTQKLILVLMIQETSRRTETVLHLVLRQVLTRHSTQDIAYETVLRRYVVGAKSERGRFI